MQYDESLPVTLDEEIDKSIEKIKGFMPEIMRGISFSSKRDSQTTLSLMSLNMIDAGPYRVLRQILAQIDRKYTALKENIYRLSKRKIQIEELLDKEDRSALDNLKISKYQEDIKAAKAPINNCIKEIGALQERYKEVIKNHNIPEKWDEKDFEAAEIEHHIKSIFRLAVRDRMAGGANMGTMEYMEQFGIEPMLAYAMADRFLNNVKTMLVKGMPVTIDIRYAFYDEAYKTFRNEYKRAMNRIGLDSIIYSDWLMREESK